VAKNPGKRTSRFEQISPPDPLVGRVHAGPSTVLVESGRHRPAADLLRVRFDVLTRLRMPGPSHVLDEMAHPVAS
jgi:hypothetical protein